MIRMRPHPKTGYCPLCRKVPADRATHFHTPWQILLWLWDGSVIAKLLITTGGVWLTWGLGFLVAYLRDNW